MQAICPNKTHYKVMKYVLEVRTSIYELGEVYQAQNNVSVFVKIRNSIVFGERKRKPQATSELFSLTLICTFHSTKPKFSPHASLKLSFSK